ncbi:hypothetical protein CDO73_23060 [Saccharibacillus sp. O23]|nr:hypothetical protein CDO73_23060 [Saccharibacillus sp. O23]
MNTTPFGIYILDRRRENRPAVPFFAPDIAQRLYLEIKLSIRALRSFAVQTGNIGKRKTKAGFFAERKSERTKEESA